MKVLVTGGAGFIGSHIVDRLLEEGHEVLVVDDLSNGKESNINKQAKFYRLDIQDAALEAIFQKEQPDYVNHHAAQMDVRRSVADPIFDAKINILGTINILQNCVKHKVKKVVFASSGGAIYGEQEAFPASETHPLRPISPYGITKLVAEHYLYYFKVVHGLNYVSLRYGNIYGPRQDPFGEAGVVAIFIQKMLKKEQPIIYGNGDQTRDFVFVEDVVNANMMAIQSNSPKNIFNIGTGRETTINQIFNYLKKILSSSFNEEHGPSKQGEQLRSVLNSATAKEFLGWEPRVDLLYGLKRTCEYFQEIGSG